MNWNNTTLNCLIKEEFLPFRKADLLDEEIMEEIEKDLPDIPHVFFSSIANKNIDALKDHIWKEINN